MQGLPKEVLHKQVSLFSCYLAFTGLLTQNAVYQCFVLARYKSQPNRNSDQFCYFEITIIFVSILDRKLTQITAAGTEKREICNPVVQGDAHS